MSIALTSPPETAKDWKALTSFRASPSMQRQLVNRVVSKIRPAPLRALTWGSPAYIQRIERAMGGLSLDYFPITIMRLPTLQGRPVGPEDLLATIRKGINDFVPQDYTTFTPYEALLDEALWAGDSPEGAVLHIDMKLTSQWLNMDDGSVACVEASLRHWVFSTVWTPGDLYHPVSGSRMFGIFDSTTSIPLIIASDHALTGETSRFRARSYTLYTMGSDRIAHGMARAFPYGVWQSQRIIWSTLQQRACDFINANGGKARVDPPLAYVFDWDKVEADPLTYEPAVEWVIPPVEGEGIMGRMG